jgi:gluconolactonase
LPAADGPDIAAKLAAAKVERYSPAPGYSEGPTWRDGEVFFCSGALLRVTKDRQLRKYLDINPAGTFLCADGRILICDNKGPALLELTPDGKVNVLVEQFDGKKLNSLNDLTVDKAGNVYWTDPNGSTRENPAGKVFRVRPDGRVDLLAADLAFPNGLDVDPANKYLYLIESQTAKILRYDLPADDQPLGKPVVFFALGGSGGDGCVFDAAGNFWVADFHRPDTKKGRITVISPEAKVLGCLNIPAGAVSNITFGGPKHDEIFVTTGDPPGVFHAAVGVVGFKGHPGKKMRVVRTLDLRPVDEPVSVK